MKLFHHDFEFKLDDQWWAEAGMTAFAPEGRSYRVDLNAFPDRTICEVPITEIEPVRRRLSHGVFNDDPVTGLSAKDRVVSILRAFRENAAIPPVELIRLPSSARLTYKLTHGAHRFYLSIAVRFTHIPAVKGVEWPLIQS
jgi:hypothetical protein